jgi:hypothetical protein
MDLICNKTLLAQEVHPLKNFPVVLTLSCMKTLQLSLSRIHKIKQKNPQVMKYFSSKPQVANSSQNPKVANSSSNPQIMKFCYPQVTNPS